MMTLLWIVSAVLFTLLFLIGIVVIRRSGSGAAAADGPKRDAESQLLFLAADLTLPAPAVAQGIGDARDLEYVRSQTPRLQREFCRDRRRLARLWLQESGHQLTRLMRLHRLISRYSADLSLRVECRVLVDSLALRAVLFIALALVSVTGPFRAGSLGRLSIALFDRLSNSVESAAEKLDVTQRASIRADWARMAQA